jgi:hypothetical protein
MLYHRRRLKTSQTFPLDATDDDRMSLGREKQERRQQLWVEVNSLPDVSRHVFYDQLNEPLVSGDFDRWTDKPQEYEDAYRANRRRMQGNRGKELQKKRSEYVERSFAHACETGGARRTWVTRDRDGNEALQDGGGGEKSGPDYAKAVRSGQAEMPAGAGRPVLCAILRH